MKKLLYLLSVFCLSGYSQTDVEVKSAYAEIVVADTLYLSGYYENVRIESPHTVRVISKLNEASAALYKPYPAIGTKITKGSICEYKGEAIHVVKDHLIEWDNPKDHPEYYCFYRAEKPDLLWVENEKVSEKDERMFKGVTYVCQISHLTTDELAPDKAEKYWKPKEKPGEKPIEIIKEKP